MSAPSHCIRRLTLEIAHPDEETAWALQCDLALLFDRTLRPIIEQSCSQWDDPHALRRIDSLTVDLGVLRLDRLEQELPDRLAVQLDALLSARIREEGARQFLQGRRAVDEELHDALPAAARAAGEQDWTAQLELVAYFLRTGNLPWWADPAQPRVIDHALERLLPHAAHAPAEVLRSICSGSEERLRLIHACTEERLAALFSALAAPGSGIQPGEVALLARAGEARSLAPPNRWRSRWWSVILLSVASARHAEVEPARFWRDALQQTARALGISYRTVVSSLVRGTDGSAGAGPTDCPREPVAVESARPHGPAERRAEHGEPRALSSAVRPESLHGFLRTLLVELEEFEEPSVLRNSDRTPQARPSSDLASTESSERAARDPDPAAPSSVDGPAPRETSAAAHRSVARSAPARSLAAAAHPSRPGVVGRAELRAIPFQTDGPDGLRTAPPLDLRYSDTDEVYVENAGLVILWPFLGSFFARLGLQEDKRFKASSAAHRAVGLLHHLVSGDLDPAEYQVTLPKLLCGLPLDAVFDFGPPVTQEEAAECQALLTAVIVSAPILREISLDGFRGSFLLRRGVIRAAGGSWLLCVERASYDVVLERFPWGLSWVRLPWMEAPLGVEW